MTATTQSHRRRTQQQEDQIEHEVERPVRRRRWPMRLAVAFVLLAIVVWFLPGLVAHTPLLGWAVGQATADLDGSVHIGSASLGWLSSISVQDIEVRDKEGRAIAKVQSASSEKSLVGLLANLSSLGKFRLEKPQLEVVLRADGSNLEDLLANYLKKPQEPGEPIGLELEIVDGSVHLVNQVHNRAWQIEKLTASVALSGDEPQLIDVKTSASIADAQPGKFEAMLAMRGTASGQFSVTAETLPLALLDGILARLPGKLQLAGRLGTKLNGQWGGASGKIEVQGDLGVNAFTLSGAALGTDQLQLTAIEAVVRAAGDTNHVDIQRAHIACDVAQLDASGSVDVAKLTGPAGVLNGLLEQTCEARGEMDVARLAALLPSTLRIRPQTRITSGKAELAIASRRTDQGMTWQGALAAKDFKALDNGREIAWDKPISFRFDAHQSPTGPVVDLLTCESEFLRVNVAGNFDDLAGNAQFDLKQLADQLDRFVDLSDVQMAGEGWARGHWKRSAAGEFEAQADVNVTKFAVQLPGCKPLVEPSVTIALRAKGNGSWDTLTTATRVHEATLELATQAEQATVQTTAAIANVREAWPLRIELTGKFEKLLPRLALWLPLDGYQAAGAVEFAADASASLDAVQVRNMQLNVKPLQLVVPSIASDKPSITINEPSVELAAAGTWQRATRKVTLSSLTLASGTVGARGDNLVCALPEKGPFELSGALKYQADMARIVQMFVDRTKPPAWSVSGMVVGSAELKPAPGGLAAQLDADITNLTVGGTTGNPLTEPRIHIAAKGNYNTAARTLKIEQAEIASTALAATMAGGMTQGKQTNVAANGQMSYDLARLTGLMRPYLGEQIRLVGRASSPFAYDGPLDPATARGYAGLQWESAVIYGFPIGRGELKAKLADGVLTTDPIDVEVSGGRMSLAPCVKLAPAAELTMPAGKLAEQIQITPGMCASAMKYAMPILADVAEARGSFSIQLDGCRIPLADPAKGDIAGKLLIHSIDVAPGPMIRELAVLMGRAAPGKLRQESVVPFRMVEGRVYHQGLELIFPDITIRTQGSVGLDQTLSMVIETPVPPKWIEAMGNTPVANALRNQVLQIPLGGTLSKPTLDRKVIDNLNQQMIRNTARDVIEDQLGKQLDRLFTPPSK